MLKIMEYFSQYYEDESMNDRQVLVQKMQDTENIRQKYLKEFKSYLNYLFKEMYSMKK